MNILMKFNVKIEKKYVYIIVAALLLNAAVLGVYAYKSGGPPSYLGHSSEEVEVNVSGQSITLQQFIDNGGFGGAHCSWMHADKTKIKDIIGNGITGFCKFSQSGKDYYGNVDAVNTLNGQFYDSPLAYCGSDYNPGNVAFDYYICK